MKKDEAEQFVAKIVEKNFETEINIKNIRQILANEFGKNILDYGFGKHYLKTFIENLEFYDFGKYDEIKQIFYLNQFNDFITTLLIQKMKR